MKKIYCMALLVISNLLEAAEPVLPEKLLVGWLQGPNALAVIGYCIPEFTQEKLEILRRDSIRSTAIVVREGRGDTPYLIAAGDKVVCIDRNGPAKPMLPSAFYRKVIRLEGASEQTQEKLFQSLARQVATRGAADGLIKFSNGNAYEIVLTVADEAPVDILYSANFVKAGEYDESKYRVVVVDQILSVSLTNYGPGKRRGLSILQDELAPRPLHGEHLQVAGNEMTSRYAFSDTAWDFSNGSSLRFRAGGIASFQPKQGNEKVGIWHIQNGCLYFNYGNIFGSAMLENDERLFVEFRNPLAEPEKKERRWTATLSRGWF